MAASFGIRHEWGKLREAIVGIAPVEDIVLFHDQTARWMAPEAAEFGRAHAGKRLADVAPERARHIGEQVEALADLLKGEGVAVHRPERLDGGERTLLAPHGEGNQLFVHDPMVVVGSHLIEGSIRLKCRQRERYGLRHTIRSLAQRPGTRWSSVPIGSPDGVEGPFLEGGDVVLNGPEIYIGISGCASDLLGIDWLQALLGVEYKLIPIAMRSNVLHLDWVLTLIRPGLVIWCPERLVDGLPMSLRGWDAITLSTPESDRLMGNCLVLDEGRVIVEAGATRLTAELTRRGVQVLPLPFDGPISLGGGLRSICRPLLRESEST